MKNKKILQAVTALSLLTVLAANNSAFSQTASDIIASEININPNNNIQDLAGVTSLMSAVASNDLEGVRFFSQASKSMIDQKNVGGATALNIAARSGNIEAATILLAAGASPNIADNEGWTPLMRAASVKNIDMLILLLGNKADYAMVNNDNETAIIISTNANCLPCLEQIFSRIDRKNESASGSDWFSKQLVTSYQIAQVKQNAEMKEFLMRYLDQNSQNNMAQNKNATATKYVLSGGAGESQKDNITSEYVDNEKNFRPKYMENLKKNSAHGTQFDHDMTYPKAAPLDGSFDKTVTTQGDFAKESYAGIGANQISTANNTVAKKFKFVTDNADRNIANKGQVNSAIFVVPSMTTPDENIVSNNVTVAAGSAAIEIEPTTNYVTSSNGVAIYKFKEGSPKLEKKPVKKIKIEKKVEKNDVVKPQVKQTQVKQDKPKISNKSALVAQDNFTYSQKEEVIKETVSEVKSNPNSIKQIKVETVKTAKPEIKEQVDAKEVEVTVTSNSQRIQAVSSAKKMYNTKTINEAVAQE